MNSLSVIIITKNESTDIRACLDSVRWADEIVVVDGGSRDDTVTICREYTDRVYICADWSGFGPQKNRALSYATGEWVLSVDADERVSPALRKEIEHAMVSERCVGYEIPRRSSYCGRALRHGGWWPDYVTRLFRRGTARFSDDLVHERLLVNGATGTLSQPLLHTTYRDLEEVLAKINEYSSAAALIMHGQKKTAGLATAILHGLWSFMRTYFLRCGFLDGKEGFMLAVSNAENSYYRYVKLMLMAKK